MFNKIHKEWWFRWMVIGVLIRLILMPITLHPDLWGHSFVAYFFAYEGIFNPYEYLLTLSQDHPLVANFGVGDIFIYPPLTYFTFGFFRILVKPFVDPNFIPWLMENVGQAHTYQNIGWILFWFKLPYLIFDIVTAFLLSSVFKKQENKKRAFILWIFNPVTLYATFMMGQFDILPVLFTVLSVYLYKNKKYNWAAASLGVGAAYKMYPILLLVPLVVLAKSKFLDRVKLLLIGIAPFLVTILPYLGSSAFRQMVLFSPKSSKMLFMNWKLTAAEGIYPFIFILMLIYWFSFYAKRKIDISLLFLSVILLIFSVSHYHPQWFLWVTPFLVWSLVKNNSVWPILLALALIWLYIVFSFEPSLNIGLFHVLWPDLKNVLGLTSVLSSKTDINQLNSLIRSVFAASSVMLVYNLKDA